MTRKRAAIADVHRWVEYAITAGIHDNPFPESDKRHRIFIRKLAHARGVESAFDDVASVYGFNATARVVPRPPLLSLDELTASIG